MPRKIRSLLCAGTAAIIWAGPALAGETGVDATGGSPSIESLQKQIDELSRQLQELKANQQKQQQAAQPGGTPQETAAVPPLPLPAKAGPPQPAFGAIGAGAPGTARSAEAGVAIQKGRALISSPDGRFSMALRLLGQFDTAYYMQGAGARALAPSYGPELASGGNFRRAWLGAYGTAFGDWSYVANFDFGGAGGSSDTGHIQSLFLEYDGLRPFAFRIGAYPPPAGLEDGTPSSDTMFLERNSPSDLARNLGGGESRDAATILYATDRIFGAFSVTGGKVGDSPVYQQQNALLGRLSGLLYSDDDTKLVLGASGTDILKLPDLTPGPNPTTAVTLSDPPEITVDSNGTKLVSTGSLSARGVTQWGVEGAGEWRNLYGQAGYFGYQVDRSHYGLPSPDFGGWYAQASWILTGETKPYRRSVGAFAMPEPEDPFDLDHGGTGAWELVGRYSDLDLNDQEGAPGTSTPTGGVRGGQQKIWTAGVNWYPNSLFRFMLDYQNIGVDRLSSSGANVGQTVQAISLRTEINY